MGLESGFQRSYRPREFAGIQCFGKIRTYELQVRNNHKREETLNDRSKMWTY